MTEQLDIFEALDALDGFDTWPPFADPVYAMPGLTTEELARRARCSVETMRTILVQEEKAGRVIREGDGWRATAQLVQELGPSIAAIQPESEAA